jgi:hypothetical protein
MANTTKKSVFDALKPKNIILNALRQQLSPQGIIKITFIFSTVDDHYNVLVGKSDGKPLSLNLTEEEMNKIKKILVTKIETKIKESIKKDITAIIIEIELIKSEINIFTQDIKGDVELFNYDI